MARIALAAAMTFTATVLLWAGRDTTLVPDEQRLFGDLVEFGEIAFFPHNGHLTVLRNLLYFAVLETFGTEHLVFRLISVTGVLLCGLLLFLIARSRVGEPVAVLCAVLLMLLGASWDVLLATVGIVALYSVALGLAALLALERETRGRDLAACGLLCGSIATFTFGLAFLAGAIVAVGLRASRASRFWVPAIPAVLYVAWRAWAAQFDEANPLAVSNLLLVPEFAANSLGAAAAALAGLTFPLGFTLSQSGPDVRWGPVLGVAIILAVAWRLSRPPAPIALWSGLAVAASMWVILALAVAPDRTPEQPRYLFPVATALLLVLTAAGSGLRFSRRVLGILAAAVVLAVMGNLKVLIDAGHLLRAEAAEDQAGYAMYELAGEDAEREFTGDEADGPSALIPAGYYLRAAERFGSLAMAPSQVALQVPEVRQSADATLIGVLGIDARRSGPPPAGCIADRMTPGEEEAVSVSRQRAVYLRSPSERLLGLRRFADASTGLRIPAGWSQLRLPADSYSEPWLIEWGRGLMAVC